MTDARPLLAFALAEFAAEAVHAGDEIVVTLRGNGDLAIVERLSSLFTSVHEHAIASRTPEVRVDLRGTEYMNSACLNVLVNWLRAVRALGGADRYAIRFVPNRGAHWQRTSLQALAAFGGGVVTVEVDE